MLYQNNNLVLHFYNAIFIRDNEFVKFCLNNKLINYTFHGDSFQFYETMNKEYFHSMYLNSNNTRRYSNFMDIIKEMIDENK